MTCGLLKSLDVDENGTLSTEEFVDGCLNMRGAPTGIQFAKLAKDVQDLRHGMKRLLRETRRTAEDSRRQLGLLSLPTTPLFSADRGLLGQVENEHGSLCTPDGWNERL